MARLSKKLKQEWEFFINPKTGRKTYNDLCRKCRNDCKQSFRAIVVGCPLYCSKEVSNRRQTATISTIWDKRINYYSIQNKTAVVIILFTRRSKQFK